MCACFTRVYYTVSYTISNALASDRTGTKPCLNVAVSSRALLARKKPGGKSVVPHPGNRIHNAVPSLRHCNLFSLSQSNLW